jgi:phosphoribosylformylglycinamidine cyclo-ligase
MNHDPRHSSSTTPVQHGGLSYKKSGVNIDAGNALIDMIKPAAAKTRRSGVTTGLGGFGAIFDIKATGYKDPLLVATTDGVGTKVKIAVEIRSYKTIGIDLVAMCVNDLVVQGAEPLFFLDYYATGGLQLDRAATIIESIANGCVEAGCALVGGETAEMPGIYQGAEIDMAGFAVGAVERDAVITGQNIQAGDVILGCASTGVHSNGYSLVRKVVEHLKADYSKPAPFSPHQTLGEALLTPTRIYVKSCLAAAKTGDVQGFVHITGGGLIDNIPRVLPEGLGAEIDAKSWFVPEVFSWLQKGGNVPAVEMLRTFNCGIGMVVIVRPDKVDSIMASLQQHGEEVYRIGEITPRAADRDFVHFHNVEALWAA